ncbi:uncharacterized protein C8Q71DRAFT_736785 [Rhodofomes roseus]|uniref:Uncharacterized protein n=1 Tax=Rhodofomes roseus TaxID=34475 RepID=A0ABQ8KS57_9APHY|nr:uncharacterized protein C8Q71DRAFT_736785 [Rhodofomes roseus]KAH9841409.1 hypothetical protein C8Q71DRAFT_736785 [Rhodofomes roseus]
MHCIRTVDCFPPFVTLPTSRPQLPLSIVYPSRLLSAAPYYSAIRSSPIDVGLLSRCVCTHPADYARAVQVATRACNALADVLVLITTWRVTYRVAKLSRSMSVEPSLSKLILRDGSVYFAVLFVLNVLNTTLWVVDIYKNVTVFSNVLSVILLSHLFINLRTTALNHDSSLSGQSSVMSDVRFSGVLGGMGSAVAGSFALSSEHQDGEDYEEGELEAYEPEDGNDIIDIISGDEAARMLTAAVADPDEPAISPSNAAEDMISQVRRSFGTRYEPRA